MDFSTTNLPDYIKKCLKELPNVLDDKETEEGQKPDIRKAIDMYEKQALP